tara:strand:+ start:33 stop:710 length:678 start_codon:yes stop_codon:yes gene_type:complete
MDVRSNPYFGLIKDSDNGGKDLENMCLILQENGDKCLCEGRKSTHAWFSQSVNDNAHFGPGCNDTITYGDGDECLLATICQNRFPEITLPPCKDGNACKYPLWIGAASGFEILQDDENLCKRWDCIDDAHDGTKPNRWHTGENSTEHINAWREYVSKLRNINTDFVLPTQPVITSPNEYCLSRSSLDCYVNGKNVSSDETNSFDQEKLHDIGCLLAKRYNKFCDP